LLWPLFNTDSKNDFQTKRKTAKRSPRMRSPRGRVSSKELDKLDLNYVSPMRGNGRRSRRLRKSHKQRRR